MTLPRTCGSRGVSTKTRLVEQQNLLVIENWNLKHQIGQPVRFWTGPREGEGKTGKTWSEAQLLSGHTPVVFIRDETGKNIGCVALTHVEAVISAVQP